MVFSRSVRSCVEMTSVVLTSVDSWASSTAEEDDIPEKMFRRIRERIQAEFRERALQQLRREAEQRMEIQLSEKEEPTCSIYTLKVSYTSFSFHRAESGTSGKYKGHNNVESGVQYNSYS